MNDNLKRNLDEVADSDELDDSVEGHINFKGLEGDSPEIRNRGIADAGDDELKRIV